MTNKICTLSIALLLAGCSPAPKPDTGWDAIVACQKDPACAERKQKHWDDIHAAPDEIAALKRRVAELEARIKPSDLGTSTTTIHPATLYWRDTSATVTSVPNGEFDLGDVKLYSSKKDPAKARFHYAGGAWCNVWADDQGIHWEACK